MPVQLITDTSHLAHYALAIKQRIICLLIFFHFSAFSIYYTVFLPLFHIHVYFHML